MTTTMTQDELKRLAARTALRYLDGARIVGVGTGSTVKHFIDALAERKDSIDGTVSSSEQSTRLLAAHGIKVLDLNEVDAIAVYVDGADECDGNRCLIKGGGGALTREKIIAAVAKKFVCIIDPAKRVDVLGKFPLPVEVIPMARSFVARELAKLGGTPELRQGVTTDNGNLVLDVRGLTILDPVGLETAINMIPGVVTNGIFARRPADVLLLAGSEGVKTYKRVR